MNIGRSLVSAVRQRAPALGNRNFRVYFLGSISSFIGSWMQTTAQAWLVLQITHSPVALSTVVALQFLPVTFFSLFGGTIADRFPRRPLLYVTQSLLALQALLLAILSLSGTAQIWEIYILAAMLGTINAIDAPVTQALVAQLVGRRDLPNAIILNALIQNLGRITGPAIAGMVIGFFGVPAAFFINVASFAGTLSGLTLIRANELQPITLRPKSGNTFKQVWEGLSFASRTPPIMLVIIATSFIGMFGQNFSVTVPLVSTYLLNASVEQFGVLNSCLGMGSFFSAIFLTSFGVPSSRRFLAAGMLFGLTLFAISLSRSFFITGPLFFLVGCASVTFTTSVNASLQMASPDHMRGRMASILQLMIPGFLPVGSEIAGSVAHAFGVSTALELNGGICCVGVIAAIVYRYRMRAVLSLQGANVQEPVIASEAKQSS